MRSDFSSSTVILLKTRQEVLHRWNLCRHGCMWWSQSYSIQVREYFHPLLNSNIKLISLRYRSLDCNWFLPHSFLFYTNLSYCYDMFMLGLKNFQATIYSGNVLALYMSKPPGFKYNSGMYLFVKCPDISKFEWCVEHNLWNLFTCHATMTLLLKLSVFLLVPGIHSPLLPHREMPSWVFTCEPWVIGLQSSGTDSPRYILLIFSLAFWLHNLWTLVERYIKKISAFLCRDSNSTFISFNEKFSGLWTTNYKTGEGRSNEDGHESIPQLGRITREVSENSG